MPREGELARLVAARVLAQRDREGRSLSALARDAQVSKATIAAIESGESNITLDTLGALAAALGSHPCTLLCPDEGHEHH